MQHVPQPSENTGTQKTSPTGFVRALISRVVRTAMVHFRLQNAVSKGTSDVHHRARRQGGVHSSSIYL